MDKVINQQKVNTCGESKFHQKIYIIWKITMTMIVPQISLPYTLVTWIQHSHNIEMWSHDKNNDIIITHTNDTF